MARPRKTGAFIESDVLHHLRTKIAGAAGFGLWSAALVWSDENLTDGHVPTEAAYRLLPGARAAAARVTKSGFWSECMEHADCFLLRAYAEDGRGRPRQPTRARLDEERARQRERDARKQSSRAVPAGNVPGTAREPVRLDTTTSLDLPPLYSPQGEPSPPAPETTSRRKRKIPADFAPNDDHRAFGAEHRIDVDEQFAAFRDHALMTNRVGIDWNAGFRNWLRKAVEFRDARGGPVEKPKSLRERYAGTEL